MTTTKTRPAAQDLAESAFCESLQIDEEAGVIRGVKVLGRESRNGRVYSPTALDEAAKLYDGCSVCLDHPSDPGAVRSVTEGWGVLRSPRVSREGVFADLHYIKSHAQTAAIVERAQRFPSNFGLSHNARGVVVEGRDGEPDVVSSIEYVESVDLVSRPATNRGLFESEQRRKGPKMTTVKSVLERLSKSKSEAKRLFALLEMDQFEAMSDAPVEMDDPATPEDEMAASIESLVLAVLRDDSLDAAGMVAKIRQILNVKDKLADSGTPSDAPADESGDSGDSAQMAEQLRRLELRDELRDLCEEFDVRFSGLSKLHQKLLTTLDTDKERRELMESIATPATTTAQRQRPVARSVVESDSRASRGSFDDLLKAAKSAR